MKLTYWIGIAGAVLMMIGWYIVTDRPVTFVLLGNGHCEETDGIGSCRVYMVKNFSKWHIQKHIEEIRLHALRVTRDSLGRKCPSNVIYFRDSRWTEINRDGFQYNTMEEMDQWDKGISLIFFEMSNSFLCRVYFKCNTDGVLVSGIGTEYRYGEGTGYLE